ncbi:MAG: hypothetical protein U0176_24005 [Bacteroidia bacterium]
MALEIRRTPVLYGEEARRFLKEIENPPKSKLTTEELKEAMAKTAAMRKNANFDR